MEGGAGESGPQASRRWFKGHGLGNDYLVFETGDDWELTPTSIARVCGRWRGVGSDGIVLRLGDAPRSEAGFRLRMFNPDGSEFERSGNGLRVLAMYLAARGELGAGPFTVEVGGSRLEMEVHGRSADGEYDVSVDMGRARLGPEAVGLDRKLLESEAPAGLPPGAPSAVSIGNPHCVVFTDDLSDDALGRIGPALSTHPAFADGTNVQLVRTTGVDRIRIAIWERGVGRTSASGTSSCAAAVAAVAEGLLRPGEITVEMEGGTMLVTVTQALDVKLRGPVREVGTGELAAGFLEWLRG